MLPALAHVDTWIFDLDNTLYPASANVFAAVDRRMTDYIARLLNVDAVEARRIQKGYFNAHGTTLSGLMADHGTDPHEFLGFVHDIEMDMLAEDALLVGRIAALPGRKLVFTNGDADYAGRVLARLGLHDSFEGVYDIHATGYRPKPHPHAYAGLCEAWDVAPASALFADDMVRNLLPAREIGMTTLWIDNGSEQGGAAMTQALPEPFDFTTADLCGWLGHVLEEQ